METSGTGQEKVKVQLMSPINHDGIVYSRGLHELDADLARIFLKLKDPVNRRPIAIEGGMAPTPIPRGTTKPDR